MSYLLMILSLLSRLQNVQLVQNIEQCVLTNSTPKAIWQCILAKLGAANLTPGTTDHAVVEAAKSLAGHGRL